ncbi:ABC transporter ATP-binding protein [Streptomyces sp. SID13031]|nr:ABC transporter ATP-binding protein [Streptomyces sp. SID13031]
MSLGTALRHARAALAIAWQSAPGNVLALALLTVANGLLPVVMAWLTKILLDLLAHPSQGGQLLQYALLLSGAGIVGAALPQAKQYAKAELGRSVNLRASQDLVGALNRLIGLARFEDPRFRDRLQIAQQAGRSAPAQLVDSGLSAIQSMLILVGFAGTLVAIEPWAAVLVTAAVLPTMRAELVISRRRANLVWRTSTATRYEFAYSRLLADVQAAKEVRIYGLGQFFAARMRRELQRVQHADRQVDRRELLTQGLLGLLAAAVAGAGLWWAIRAAGNGRLTIGDVSVFIAAVAGIQSALTTMVRVTASAHQQLMMFDHFQWVVQAPTDLESGPPGSTLVPLAEGIELKDVWFRYSDDHPWVLQGVSLTIPRGATLALVGLNGAGKSTVVKLLCRLYDPVRGSIRWDGQDLRQLPIDELRRRIGVVFQDFMSYDLTAAENIAVGDLAALHDPDRIRSAAQAGGIDTALEQLPHQYETMLTRIFFSEEDRDDASTGVFLSGGQWQRIALARALIRRDAELLILDEPSSGLDAEAEYEVQLRLRRHSSVRTNLIISHRLSTLRDADLIAVLADGKVVESGDHADLMAAGGHYARLFRLQARGYRAAVGADDFGAP